MGRALAALVLIVDGLGLSRVWRAAGICWGYEDGWLFQTCELKFTDGRFTAPQC